PNIPEAEVLSGMAIASLEDVETAASLIADRCIAVWENEPAFADAAPSVPAILIKGGHGVGEPDAADDYLRMASGESVWLRGKRITNDNTHGTGCSLSSAIACGLARGFSVDVAVRDAKAYVAGALAAGLNLGRGSGPLDHMWQYGTPMPC
ncbi:MAG: bifunctional hydroxymethylpyrimidine kinase/phosphomethylpyrimidine kinase, partial [Adlercreutzia sp.]